MGIFSKKSFVHETGKDGKPKIVPEFVPTKHQRKSMETLIPKTPAPKTLRQKAARNLWG